MWVAITCLFIAVSLTGCVENPPEHSTGTSFSFHENMQEWQKDGTDLDDPPINWTVEHTTTMAYNGTGAVKLYLNNMNDAGKIWMEKAFAVNPNTAYEITVSYYFATSDYGEFNLFNIICGATTKNPETADDLIFQDDTGHHNESVQDQYLWLEKEYTFTVLSDENGSIYVNIGVWGNWETPRTYYVDEVNITINPLSAENLPDLSGSWTISYYDWMGNLTKTENATIDQENYTVSLNIEGETIAQGMILPNNLLSPFNNTDYLIKDIDFSGLGIDTIYVHNTSYLETEMPLCENCNPAVLTRS
jgi:hypothetical protein